MPGTAEETGDSGKLFPPNFEIAAGSELIVCFETLGGL
jgi:hypothetical protein